MSEERPFEVRDRRRVSAEGGAPPGAESSGGEAGTGAAEAGRGVTADEIAEAAEAMSGFPMMDLSVGGVLRMTINLLHERAWIDMGLMPDPISGQVQKNLGDARRAIDAIADLAKHVEADADEQEKRELRTLVSNLRLNFVRQSGP